MLTVYNGCLRCLDFLDHGLPNGASNHRPGDQMSVRRPLTKAIIILTTAVAAGCVVIAVAIEAGKRSKHASDSVPVGQGLRVCRKIQQKYGVDVAFEHLKYPVSTYHGPIRATNAEAARVDRYATILADEFSLYPPDLVRRSRLKRIVLCRGLSFNGQYRGARAGLRTRYALS